MQNTCKECNFFNPPKHAFDSFGGRVREKGECRRFAPRTIQIAGKDGYGDPEARGWSGWPDVEANDFCGDFEPNKQKFDEEMEEYVRLNKELDPDGKNFNPAFEAAMRDQICGDAAYEANKRDRD